MAVARFGFIFNCQSFNCQENAKRNFRNFEINKGLSFAEGEIRDYKGKKFTKKNGKIIPYTEQKQKNSKVSVSDIKVGAKFKGPSDQIVTIDTIETIKDGTVVVSSSIDGGASMYLYEPQMLADRLNEVKATKV